MRQSLYFRQQWRSNTAALAALTVAGLVIVGFVFWRLLPFTPAGPGDTVPAADEYRLSHHALAIPGSPVKLFVLDRWRGRAGGAAVNLLVVDADDASGRWMFPDNGQTILRRDELHAGDGLAAPTTGLIFTVTNTAGEKSRQSLYYYRVGGGPAVRFLTTDEIVSGEQLGTDRYLVLSRNGDRSTATIYSLIDLRVLVQKPMPDIPQ